MSPEKGKKLMKRLEDMFYEDQLRTLGLSNVENMMLRGDRITLYSFLWRGHGEGGADPLFPVSSDRMYRNDSRMHQERFRLDIRMHLFTERVVKHRIVLLREVVNMFKKHLDNAVNNTFYIFVIPEFSSLFSFFFFFPFPREQTYVNSKVLKTMYSLFLGTLGRKS